MSFREQINRTGWRSILCFVLAFCLLAISEVSGRGAQALLFWLWMPALVAGTAIMAVGVIGRLVHRRLWLRAGRGTPARIPVGPFWRRWLHVDENGADLDRAG